MKEEKNIYKGLTKIEEEIYPAYVNLKNSKYIEIEEIIKNELNEKYFKIKECLSRCGNSVQEVSEKVETIKILFSFLNTRKNLSN